MKTRFLLVPLLILSVFPCPVHAEDAVPAVQEVPAIQEEPYGRMPDGRTVKVFTLTNRNGYRARVIEYGAILASFEAPDKEGKIEDLTHGFATLESWLHNPNYLGATVGRFGNRIKDGKFTLDGKLYTLATNNSPGGIPCHLHGGGRGFNQKLWSGKATQEGVELSYLSQDGEEGYPGNLNVTVTYRLNDDNELSWHAKATTDAPTVVNLVNHSYWNLSGDPETTILDHELTLHADHYLPTNSGLIPTGEIAPVKDTPMDFTTPHVIGERIDDDFEALRLGSGYDHAWVLKEGSGTRLAARLKDPKSGRVMEISTNQPAIQFYAGNVLDGRDVGKKGIAYRKRSALCLETEGFPDSPNQPSFPSPVLRPGETYEHTMVFQFFAE